MSIGAGKLSCQKPEGRRTKTVEIPSESVCSVRLYPTESSAERTTSSGPMMLGVPLSTKPRYQSVYTLLRTVGGEPTDRYEVRDRLSVDDKESRVDLCLIEGDPRVMLQLGCSNVVLV